MALVLVLALLILVPLLEQQIVTLVESLPRYRDWLVGTGAAVGRAAHRAADRLAGWTRSVWSELVRSTGSSAGGVATTVFGYVSRSGFALLGMDRQHRAAADPDLLLPARLGPAGRARRRRWCRATISGPCAAGARIRCEVLGASCAGSCW
jgi:hypothetical protein